MTILHKYYRIDNRFLEVLINNEIWFSNPFEFNDPYDCNLTIDSNNTFAEIYDYIIEVSKKYRKEFIERGDDLSEEAILKIANYRYSNPEKLRETLRDNMLMELGNKGIACFSKSDNILLMWSHYADSHKGACLTFDPSKDPDYFKYPYNVEYPKDYPIVNFINEKNPHKRAKHMLATKSQDWVYEEEIRIVKDKQDHPKFRGNIKFKKDCLVSIKFGYKADSNDIKTIKELRDKEGYGHARLFKANLKDGEFGIEYKEIV